MPIFAAGMTIRTNHTPLFRALLLLAVFASAYAGRSFHTHTAEYYAAQRTDTANGAASFVDSCPICHFHIFTNRPAEEVTLTVFFVLIAAVPVLCALRPSAALPLAAAMRAPPASL